MPLGVQFGTSSTGLNTCVIRDIDVSTPRPRLPPRALPDDVRAKLGFSRPRSHSTEGETNETSQTAATSTMVPPPRRRNQEEEEERPLPLVMRQSMGGTLPKQTLGINSSRTNEMLPPRHSLGGTTNMNKSGKASTTNLFGPVPTVSTTMITGNRSSLGGKTAQPKLLAALNNTGGPSMKEKPRRLKM